MSDQGCDVTNVFEELGLPNAEEELARVNMSQMIRLRMDELRLTRQEAVARLGADEDELSRIVRGHVDGLTIDRLAHHLLRLGVRVEIKMVPEPAGVEQARMLVLAA